MQATVRGFDPVTRSGSVFLDDGTVAGFGPAALAGSGLRLLRPGQRVAIACGSGGVIVALTLATFALPGPAPQPGTGSQPGRQPDTGSQPGRPRS